MDPWDYDQRCLRCGKCIEAGPQYSDVDMIDSLIGYLKGGMETGHDITMCLTCGKCESACPEKLSLKLLIKEARLKRVTASGLTDINFICDPDYERNIFKTAAEVEEPLHFEPRPAEVVYYPGCYSSYIHKTMVLAITRLMQRAGVDFSVLDGLDYCCGLAAAGDRKSVV